jgi:hypothetical protein
VGDCLAQGTAPGTVTPAMLENAAEQTLGQRVTLTPDALRAALDPWQAVERRSLVGSPAPRVVRPQLEAAAGQLAADQTDLGAIRERLRAADETLERAADAILR